MNRLRRFYKNAGSMNIAKTSVFLLILFFALKKDYTTGLWIYTVPLVILGVLFPFIFRDKIVQHFDKSYKYLNYFAYGAIALAIISGKSGGSETGSLRMVLAFVFSTYISAYYWLLSDLRIFIAQK
jgi:phosphoglycerol transferase MdoB-like AlkP superfamily enzyme